MNFQALEQIAETINTKGIDFLTVIKADLAAGTLSKLVPGLAGFEAEAVKIVDFLLKFEPAVIPAVIAVLKILAAAFPPKAV